MQVDAAPFRLPEVAGPQTPPVLPEDPELGAEEPARRPARVANPEFATRGARARDEMDRLLMPPGPPPVRRGPVDVGRRRGPRPFDVPPRGRPRGPVVGGPRPPLGPGAGPPLPGPPVGPLPGPVNPDGQPVGGGNPPGPPIPPGPGPVNPDGRPGPAVGADGNPLPPGANPPMGGGRAEKAAQDQQAATDAQQAATIRQQIAADAQKQQMERWKILQDTMTKCFEILQDVTINKAKVASKGCQAFQQYMRG